MQSVDPIVIGSASFAAKSVIEMLVQTYLKPKLAKLLQKHNRDQALVEHALSEQFTEYIERTYLKHSFLSTLVFQREKVDLKSLYIPLTVLPANRDERAESYTLNSFTDNFIPKLNNVLITDAAGMGKSTLMKFLMLSCIDENKGIPIFVELRKLSKSHNIIDFMINELSPVNEAVDEQLILDLVRRGDFVFFLDGYDEILHEDRELVTSALHDFISKANKNKFVLTSRPETGLTSFASFHAFRIRPLNLDQAFTLLRKYDPRNEIAEVLITKLKEPESSNIHEFLANPLLVSLLFQSYEHTPIIPSKKSSFYRQVFDALYHRHDLSKDGAYVRKKFSGLNVDDFHTVLRNIGYITAKSGRLEYEKDELLIIIGEAKAKCPNFAFQVSNFFEDVLRTVPLFAADGDLYRWAHKSIQEYFAAQFICRDAKESQKDILVRIAHPRKIDKYFNILDLCYDIDYRTFRQAIIYKLAKDYVGYYETSYQDFAGSNVSPDDIETRKMLTFDTTHIIIPWTVYSQSLLDGELSKRNPVNKRKVSFQNIDFDAVEEEVRRSSGLDFDEFRFGIRFHSGNLSRKDLLFGIVFGHYNELGRLLFYKNDPIVYRKLPVKLKEIVSGGPENARNFPTDFEKIMTVDDDTSSIINSEDNFKKTNLFLQPVSTKGAFYKVRECRKVVTEVDRELKADGEGSLLKDL